MSRRAWIIASLLVLSGAGGWLKYRQMRRSLFAATGPTTAPVATQKELHFGYDQGLQSDGVPATWQSRVIKGKMHLELVDGPVPRGPKAVHVICQKSHFLIWNASCPYNPEEFPLLKWSWKASVLPTNADVRHSDLIPFVGDNRNDAVVQVLVGFEGNDVLCYLWDTTAPVGTEVEEPSPVARVRTQVIDTGTTHLNEWVPHQVNICDDYRRRYGKPPGKVLGISVQTNSNHTASNGDGVISEIIAARP